MGKTTVAAQFMHLGCASHNSDLAAHQALLSDGAAFEEVAVTFPEAWDKKKHVIKRPVLADIIFKDADKKTQLENILHPIVRADQVDFLRHQKKMERSIAILDIPLLFETGAEERVDHVVVVTAPYFVQRMRVLNRSNMTKEKFDAILTTQMPDIEKRNRADFIVQTGLGRAYSFRQVKQILRELS